METCENMLGEIQKLVDCNWCVGSKVYWVELTRVQLLDICRGLSFLHSLEIVHGDLKGVRLGFFLCYTLVSSDLTISSQDNILVDKSGCPRLNDFGFSSITSLSCTETSTHLIRGGHRWMAPELFNINAPNNEGKPVPFTRESDVFDLGMVTFEVQNVHHG